MISSGEKMSGDARQGDLSKEEMEFLGRLFLTKTTQVAAYRTAMGKTEEEFDKSDADRASALKKALLQSDAGHYFMVALEFLVHFTKDILEGDDILRFYSRVVENKEKDQFGLDASLADRLSAARDMAKILKLLSDSIEVKADSRFADVLSKARRRAAKGERDAP